MAAIAIDYGHNRTSYCHVEYWSNGRDYRVSVYPTADEMQAIVAEQVRRQRVRMLSRAEWCEMKPRALNSFGYRWPRVHARPRMGRR